MQLDPVDGPECPRCGCRDCRVESTYKRWGKPFATVRCAHCNKRHEAPQAAESDKPTEPETNPATWPYPKCPACNSSRTKVRRTKKPIRYQECVACGHKFKSYDPHCG